jgi:acyl dehydratase
MSSPRERAAAGLQVGDVFVASRTVSREDVERFAAVSRDHNPVHVDERFARAHGFRAPVAHGLLGASLVTEIGGQIGWLASGMSFRFRSPAYPGDTLTCTLTITAIDDRSRAHAAAAVVNQDGVTVIEAELWGVVPTGEARGVLRAMLDEGDPTNGAARGG